MAKPQWHVLFIGLLIIALTGCAMPAVSAADSQAVSPQAAVESFYGVYLQNSGYDPTQEIMHNPLVEGTYREMPYLSDELIAEVDSLVSSGPLMADPFLCAQDVPETIVAGEPTFIADDEATVPVTTSFEGHHFTVTVKQIGGEWQLTHITCQR